MKKRTRLLAALLCGAMAVSMLAGCGSSSSGSSASSTESSGAAAESGSYDQVTYAYLTFNNIPSEEDLDTVEEAINEITREKIGAEITLMPIGIAEYSSKVSLALQGGEKIDIFESLGDFSSCVATDMAMDITDLVHEYAQDTYDLIGEDWMNASVIDGKQYGIPTYKPLALTPMVIYRSDIAEELGIDMDSVETLDDLTTVFEQVKAAYPDMTPLAPTQTGDDGLSRMTYGLDYLGDSFSSIVGVLMGDSLEVTDFYATDEFKSLCETARYWYENGLIMQDAATTTSAAAELMSSGNYFCYIASYSYPEEDTAAGLSATCGNMPIGAHIMADAYLSTSDISSLSWMISSTSDVPEAAMKFLNLTFTDADIINLIIYGIKDRDYVLNEDGTMSYPEGEDSTTVPYTAQLSCGVVGNYFLMYEMEGATEGALDWELEQNQSVAVSPAMGFVYDNSGVKTEYTAVSNVLQQYVPGLFCGSIDPEDGIAKLEAALDDAGYQDILADKQAQLDEWAETAK